MMFLSTIDSNYFIDTPETAKEIFKKLLTPEDLSILEEFEEEDPVVDFLRKTMKDSSLQIDYCYDEKIFALAKFLNINPIEIEFDEKTKTFIGDVHIDKYKVFDDNELKNFKDLNKCPTWHSVIVDNVNYNIILIHQMYK